MPITLRGETLYSASEVSAMTPTGTIDSQWETHLLTGINGWDHTPYKLGKFHVNKITGLVTGEVGIRNSSGITSTQYGSNANLGTHAQLAIHYPGQFEYALMKSATTAARNQNVREINTSIDTNGNFALQGRGWNATSVNTYIGSYLETFAYIGNKYGKVYTQEYPLIHLAEGAFYRTEQVDLITGHAWLKIPVTLPTGYASNSFAFIFKNLWSGEVIFQYSLYPTTAGTMPAITLPSRAAVFGGKRFYTDIRYCEPATTYINRHNCWMNISNYTVSFSPITGQTWATGSIFYQGNPETPTQGNRQETVVGLWVPESADAIPSVNNAKFPVASAPDLAALDSFWLSPKYNHPRASDPSWATNNNRTGMLFAYHDMNTVAAGGLSNPFLGAEWSSEWIPSYRYNYTNGTSQPLYCSGVGYLGGMVTESLTSGWTCNIYAPTGTALGAAPSTLVKKWYFGTTGEMNPSVANLACFTASYLSNRAGNIVQ